MTNKVCILLYIFHNSKLSLRSKFVWAELSLLPLGVTGEFVLKQKELSLQMHRILPGNLACAGMHPNFRLPPI